MFYTITFASYSYSFTDSGLEIFSAGDMLYDHGYTKNSGAENKLRMRSAELSLFSPIDHVYDGSIGLAAHDENGEVLFELHELTVSSSKLIPRTNFKFGKYFLGVGRLNRFHQHDWPFTKAPMVHKEFFGDEGVLDTGIEANFLIPVESSIELTLGTTSGYTYGHSHTAGEKPKTPTHYARLSSFFPFSSVNGTQIGLNYFSRTDADEIQMTLFGMDGILKIREGKHAKHLFQTEMWARLIESPESEFGRQVGMYLFYDYYLGGSSFLGFRLDGFKDTTRRNPLNSKLVNNVNYKALTQVTYKSSEFASYRVSLSRELDIEEGSVLTEKSILELQSTFILGSHPAHEF